MKVRIELTKSDLQKLVIDKLASQVEGQFDPNVVQILVKSKRNYSSEWEDADFRAVYETNT